VDLLAVPFTLTSNGSPRTVVQGSEPHRVHQVAGLIQTRIGELPLAPTFGIPDPAFTFVEPTEIIAAIDNFFPEIAVTDVDVYFTETGEFVIDVIFDEGSDAVS
jgi:hypothetical protein